MSGATDGWGTQVVNTASLEAEIARLTAEVDGLKAENERLRAGIQKLLDEGAPRTVAEPYADDGKPHKGDRCPHGCYTWERCDACTDEYLAGLLAPDGET